MQLLSLNLYATKVNNMVSEAIFASKIFVWLPGFVYYYYYLVLFGFVLLLLNIIQ